VVPSRVRSLRPDVLPRASDTPRPAPGCPSTRTGSNRPAPPPRCARPPSSADPRAVQLGTTIAQEETPGVRARRRIEIDIRVENRVSKLRRPRGDPPLRIAHEGLAGKCEAV